MKKMFNWYLGLIIAVFVLGVLYEILGVDILWKIPFLHNFLMYVRGLSEGQKISIVFLLIIVTFIVLKKPYSYTQLLFRQAMDRGDLPRITFSMYNLGGFLMVLSVTVLPNRIHPKYVGICKALGLILIISSLIILRKKYGDPQELEGEKET